MKTEGRRTEDDRRRIGAEGAGMKNAGERRIPKPESLIPRFQSLSPTAAPRIVTECRRPIRGAATPDLDVVCLCYVPVSICVSVIHESVGAHASALADVYGREERR